MIFSFRFSDANFRSVFYPLFRDGIWGRKGFSHSAQSADKSRRLVFAKTPQAASPCTNFFAKCLRPGREQFCGGGGAAAAGAGENGKQKFGFEFCATYFCKQQTENHMGFFRDIIFEHQEIFSLLIGVSLLLAGWLLALIQLNPDKDFKTIMKIIPFMLIAFALLLFFFIFVR